MQALQSDQVHIQKALPGYSIKTSKKIPDDLLLQCTQSNDFPIDSPFVETTSFEEVRAQPSADQFNSRVNSMLIPTIICHGVNETSPNEEFNDSLESQSNDFNIIDFESGPRESITMEHDSLESIENYNSTAINVVIANSPNGDEIIVPIQTNENNESTNSITESNITKPIDTECISDSEEYDLKDIPGIEVASNGKIRTNSHSSHLSHLLA